MIPDLRERIRVAQRTVWSARLIVVRAQLALFTSRLKVLGRRILLWIAQVNLHIVEWRFRLQVSLGLSRPEDLD